MSRDYVTLMMGGCEAPLVVVAGEGRETYRGPHIPKPIELRSGSQEDVEAIAAEILGLTKMNWNSANDHGPFSITLTFARKVGAIMTEIPEDRTPLPGYRFYM